jgi:polar amino acid transport system permease protein
MSLDLALIQEKAPEIASGALITVAIWIGTTITGASVGLLVALIRRYAASPIGIALRAYVEIVRGSPFLVQLFLLYYGGPFIGLTLDSIPAAILALTLYSAAYYSEIFRGGFEAVPKGHIEAATCVGFTQMQTVRRVILPEMTVLVLPSLVNMAILMLKETAILSIIAVPELTLVVGAIGSQNYAFVEAMLILALTYWGLVELCGRLGRFAEARLSKFRFAA